MKTFGERLKHLREKKKRENPKWTQEYVADLVGVARTTYTAYERGTKQPQLDTVNKLADLFEVSADYLLGRTDNPNSPEGDDIPEELKDPSLGLFFKELAEAPEERREQLLKIWEILKSEGDRKPGDKKS
jgi:transcriptional regulator with XRE-family HTH domain